MRLAVGCFSAGLLMEEAEAAKESDMARQTLENRVEQLETKMSALEELPPRVANLESQILQFREEVRVEFSATRSELRGEMREIEGRLLGEIRQVVTRMLVLHEDVISRIKLLRER